MKTKLPKTSELLLESSEDQWRLMVNGLINELHSSALITMSSGQKIRIRLLITKIISPESLTAELRSHVQSNLDAAISNGVQRISNFMINKLEKNQWLFIAEVQGENKLPVIIVYYEAFKTFIYSVKMRDESKNNFLPNYLHN